MPEPRQNESKDEWMDRCMGSAEANRDFPEADQRAAFCNSRWERRDMESMFTITDYVNVSPGEAFRLLPFGKLVKDGEEREITPEMAGRFKLPHFLPPIKIGSHRDETPAGGHIKRLEVREDGLYAIPEFTDKGQKSVSEGDFRYHSPEIIWEGGLEDPETGEMIQGPLIVGDALLHTPHLGQSAALYSITETDKERNHMSDTVQVPANLWEKFMANLFPSPEDEVVPEEKPEPEVDVSQFESALSERDEYKAKLEKLEAEREREERMSALSSEFDTDEFGAAYQDIGEDEEANEILLGMEDEQRDWVLSKFKAMSAQIDESALVEERGTGGSGHEITDVEELNSFISNQAKEKGISYKEAMRTVRQEMPEVIEQVYGKE